ncbi:MAG TPA: type II toxin-antitoxin system HicA family toxin [Dehalococcoidales bacterium]|nr:type II toxin-antitoxin system HicA family toxin [Dehalococcoidales bacterium]
MSKIFENPDRSDITWIEIISLFRAVGAEISEGRGSRVRVAMKGVKAVFHRPHPLPVTNKPLVLAVRKFITEAGVFDDGI